MENTEEVYQFLEEFSKRKPKTIPQELNDYLAYVARTGDSVYQWSLVKSLFKEKLLNVITDFYEATPNGEIPPYPNVDPFNYDIMKNGLLERLDTFTSAPFTVQRICELLTYPRKQYNRVDKFMRAIEKNILVVSTREPGAQRPAEPENGEPMESIVNGSDNNSEYNVDVEMEDMSWKDNAEQSQAAEPQPSSSDTHISVDDIEARLQAKQEAPMDTQDKATAQYESVTPPELNVVSDETDMKPTDTSTPESPALNVVENDTPKPESLDTSTEEKKDVEMKTEEIKKVDPLAIPEIKIDNVEMTEQRLSEESNMATDKNEDSPIEKDAPKSPKPEEKLIEEIQQNTMDENSSDSNTKEDSEPKTITEVSTSSEESSSSSDNTDGNSNSPKPDIEAHIDIQEDNKEPAVSSDIDPKVLEDNKEPEPATEVIKESESQIQSDNYSISDVNSELPQPAPDTAASGEPQSTNLEKENLTEVSEKKVDEQKAEDTEISLENKES